MMGERQLLQQIARLLETTGPRTDVVVGPGDDAAVVTVEGHVVVACDSLVGGTHFTLDTYAPGDIGYKALAVNLSDLAAMGATPRFCLVSLVLPAGLESAFVEELFGGLLPLAHETGTAVVGGDLAGTKGPVVIDVTVLGEVAPGRAVTLSGVRPGDTIMVTGTLGDAAAGLQLLGEHGRAALSGWQRRLALAQLRPRPRVREGLVMAGARARPTAMTDVSDGLSEEIFTICGMSGVGAVIDAAALPISGPCQRAGRQLGVDPVEWALTGGEDYQLLITARPEASASLAEAVLRHTGTRLTAVGRALPADEGFSLLTGKRRRDLPRGYQHDIG